MGFTDQKKRMIGAAVSALLERIEDDLGLPLTRVLFGVFLKPGMSVNELADSLRVPQQTASRYVAVLQGRYEASSSSPVSPSSPLLALEVSQSDPRRRALFLTLEGKKRVEKLIANYSRDYEQHSRLGQS